MERAAAELFLTSLYVETTPERQDALRSAAAATKNWEGLVASLEGHGVLALFLRNLDEAAIEIPPAVASLYRARGGAQRDDHQRTRLALQRFLAASGRSGVEATLVGGSALWLDLYPDGLRRAGLLEVHVPPEHMERALDAAAQAGLLPASEALPIWWYRTTRAALPLAPSSSFLGAMRLSTRLHHPSLLLTAREPEVLARRRRSPFEGHPLFLLDPLDGMLELAVSVAARAGEDLLIRGRSHLLNAATTRTPRLALDRLLDLRTLVEKKFAEFSVADVRARANEWSAEPALRAVLECIQMGLGFPPATREWVRQVTLALASAPAVSRSKAAPALFRPDPVERLPLWLRPSDAFLARSHGLPLPAAARARRLALARHLSAAGGACAFAGLAYPLALLGRRLARKTRAAAWSGAQAPDRMSDVTDAWRTAARVAEQQKPALPRAISLPERDESVARFPDRYLG